METSVVNADNTLASSSITYTGYFDVTDHPDAVCEFQHATELVQLGTDQLHLETG